MNAFLIIRRVLKTLRHYFKVFFNLQNKIYILEGQSKLSPNAQRNLALDLDYLERRELGRTAGVTDGGVLGYAEQNSKSGLTNQIGTPVEPSPDSLDLVKVILLGAPAVGKTSIVQQFVWNNFSEDYCPTDRKHTYYPSVIINEHLYEIKISDLPVIPYFPVNSYYEWTDFRFYGLRSATAYILVFDLSNIDTFQYVRTLKEQIFESRDMRNIPVLVVGNKHDLVADKNMPGGFNSNNGNSSNCLSSNNSSSSSSNQHEPSAVATDIANLVKKHWKCGYIECSAKYNWRIVSVFKELMLMVESVEMKENSPVIDNIQEALDRNKCTIL
ncbi:ras-like protein family member 10B [Chrysoperla carnea]|uniref:ras-like protein family member 10B n=1 Tax=Chrysoperla carnea TaxID=189513 RepID=UPI001D0638DA|nr:ras-like protein family member 10B [Chrysoperla carnea]